VTDGDPGCDSQGSAQTGRAPGAAIDALSTAGMGDPSFRLAGIEAPIPGEEVVREGVQASLHS
jgi:hypothetical protein